MSKCFRPIHSGGRVICQIGDPILARRSIPHRRRIVMFESSAAIHNLSKAHGDEVNRLLRTRTGRFLEAERGRTRVV